MGVRATDRFVAKIVTRNGLAPRAAVESCLASIERGERPGPLALRLADDGLLTPEEAEKAEHAGRLLVAQRYLRLAEQLGHLEPAAAAQALQRYRQLGYPDTIAHLLLQHGQLTPSQNAEIVAADPLTLEEALAANDAAAPQASPPAADRTWAHAPAQPPATDATQVMAPPPPPTAVPPPPPPPAAATPPPAAVTTPPAPPPGAPEPGRASGEHRTGRLLQTLRGGARELAQLALRDGVLRSHELAAVLDTLPAAAREQAETLAETLVAARLLPQALADCLLAYLVVDDEQPSFAIEGYRLIAPLGFGPTGPVLLAHRNDAPGEPLAVEVLTPRLSSDARRFERFRTRTGALSLPSCASLARTTDSGRAGSGFYLARQVEPERTLAARLRAGETLTEPEAVRLAREIAEALERLGTARLVHGAIRPENIAQRRDGGWWLQDVGRTPMPPEPDPEQPPPAVDLRGYLAPEQIVGDPEDVRTDIYALGCCLFEAVTGRRPVSGASAAEIAERVLGGTLPDPREYGAAVSERFAAILRVCMTAPPDRRYGSASELLSELGALEHAEAERTVLYEEAGESAEAGSVSATQLAAAAPAEPDADDPLLGRVLGGRYRLRRRLGEGGMGVVYLADHLLMHKPVAIKILHPRLLTNRESLARFDREVRAASRFSHPNVVQIYDAGEDEGPEGPLHYMVLEYVDGKNLADLIAERGELPVPQAVSLMRDALAALAEAHAQGIVHRDMKSDNIMVCRDESGHETAKIMDFGIAKILDREAEPSRSGPLSFRTRKGVITGTPQYMSPEQAAGDPDVDWRSDLYSLGVIFYEMLTGSLPFKSNTAMGYLGKHIVEPPMPFKAVRPDLSLPPELERIVMKALEKRREDRFQSADEMRAELERCCARAGTDGDKAATKPARPGLWARIRRALFGTRPSTRRKGA